MTSRRWVLMGDPTHFSVKGGANPHTRTRLGLRRRVDRKRAVEQWQRLRDTLQDLGLRVVVVAPDPEQPGLVYPANAGFMQDVDAAHPLEKRRFHLANLLPSRAGEKPHYRRTLQAAGIACFEIDPAYRFEGEADFFPAGDAYLLTHGRLERQRFVPTLGLPPWKRLYGFRTDERVAPVLQSVVGGHARILRLGLERETHYHGDTALCAFGPGRRHLLAWGPALEPAGLARLRERYRERLLEIDDADAAQYAANSFTYTPDGGSESFLVMPAGLSERLLAQIRERRVTPVCVDVSEFLKKGGGSVKCMLGDLGAMAGDAPAEPRTRSAASR